MKKNDFLLQVNSSDNVAIALTLLKKNSKIDFFDNTLVVTEDTAVGDRIALQNLSKGAPLYQYASQFAKAKCDIQKGEVISSEIIENYEVNLKELNLNNYPTESIQTTTIQNFLADFRQESFMGYQRDNTQIGTRNYYVLIPTSFCATDIAMKLSLEFDTEKILQEYKNIDGIVAAGHTEGCGCSSGDIIDRLLKIISNTISHPNCGGALIVDLGCEKTNYTVMHEYLGDLKAFKKPIDFITIQELGGTANTMVKGREIIKKRLPEINDIQREKCSLSALVLGTECGASDSFSGISANPLIGAIADNLVDLHAKVILSETPEMLGAEEILLNRMPDIKTREKFIDGILYYQNMANNLNVNMAGNLVSGNLKGGLVNLTLKSLGSIQKGGSREIVDFLDYGDKVKKTGLSIMNGPGNDFESITGITASGANIFLFSTGMGTTEGSLIAPIIKVASNSQMYARMSDDMDFNAGNVFEDGIEETAYKLMRFLIKVASGEIKTSSERHKKRAFQVWSAGKLSL